MFISRENFASSFVIHWIKKTHCFSKISILTSASRLNSNVSMFPNLITASLTYLDGSAVKQLLKP